MAEPLVGWTWPVAVRAGRAGSGTIADNALLSSSEGSAAWPGTRGDLQEDPTLTSGGARVAGATSGYHLALARSVPERLQDLALAVS